MWSRFTAMFDSQFIMAKHPIFAGLVQHLCWSNSQLMLVNVSTSPLKISMQSRWLLYISRCYPPLNSRRCGKLGICRSFFLGNFNIYIYRCISYIYKYIYIHTNIYNIYTFIYINMYVHVNTYNYTYMYINIIQTYIYILLSILVYPRVIVEIYP